MSSVELRSKTELTSIAGTENIYVQEAGSPYTVKRTLLNTVRRWIESFTTPIGTIIMYAKATAPTNYLICDGAAVSRSTYSDLYSVIGTVYGIGDGSTTFNLPNYQAVSPKGIGNQTINTRVKTGPASLGSVIEDTFQGWQAGMGGAKTYYASLLFGDNRATSTPVTNESVIGGNTTAQGNSTMLKAMNDGTNGYPRTGAQTQDCTIGTNFCIKYQ